MSNKTLEIGATNKVTSIRCYAAHRIDMGIGRMPDTGRMVDESITILLDVKTIHKKCGKNGKQFNEIPMKQLNIVIKITPHQQH